MNYTPEWSLCQVRKGETARVLLRRRLAGLGPGLGERHSPRSLQSLEIATRQSHRFGAGIGLEYHPGIRRDAVVEQSRQAVDGAERRRHAPLAIEENVGDFVGRR